MLHGSIVAFRSRGSLKLIQAIRQLSPIFRRPINDFLLQDDSLDAVYLQIKLCFRTRVSNRRPEPVLRPVSYFYVTAKHQKSHGRYGQGHREASSLCSDRRRHPATDYVIPIVRRKMNFVQK